VRAEADRTSREGSDGGISARFDRSSRARPDHAVVLEGGVGLTARASVELGMSVAEGLRTLGVGPGDVVAFQLPNWWEAVVIGCASFRLGATLCPFPPNLQLVEVAGMLCRAKARAFFCLGDEDAAQACCQSGATPISVRSTLIGMPAFEDLMTSPVSLRASNPSREGSVAVLLFTSGTGGQPKGVLHGEAGLLAKVDNLSRAHGLTGEDVLLAPYSLGHIGGVIYNLLMPLGIGTSVVLMDRWDAGKALDLIAEEGVTFLSAVPTHFHQMLAHPNFTSKQVQTVRLAALGGTRVAPEDVAVVGESFGAVAKRSYGSTEVPTVTTSRNSDPLSTRANTDGAPIGQTQLLIVDEDGSALASSGEGELWVKGPEILLGYLDPEDEEDAFTDDGWFKTGDMGRLDDAGYLTITGRAKDIIIRGGENITPAEIERWLMLHPAVDEVAVVAMPDRLFGERACAFVATSDRGFSFDAMITWLRDQGLATHKLPERLEIRESLPMTATGKVRKDVLRREIARLCP
jgi:cyclohexanecarboxylate-CoA ligase